MTKLRMAILGCGKVTETLHLPVAAGHDGIEVVRLVDAHAPRARGLADAWGVRDVGTDYREGLEKVDAAIVALPNHLHAPVTIDLLERGIHVLVEKPMALQAEDCDRMIAASRSGTGVLAVGLVRRHYSSFRFVKQLVLGGMLGTITHVDMREGGVFAWDVASDFMFRKDAGGGVLADIGIHALDLLVWWLGDVARVEYRDDARGGVEADCELRLELQSGATVEVELSRLRRMRNTYRIVGERGTLEVGNGIDAEVQLELKGETASLLGHGVDGRNRDTSLQTVFARQLTDFVHAIRTGEPPFVSGEEGARAVRLIERCHRVREPLIHPWSADARMMRATP